MLKKIIIVVLHITSLMLGLLLTPSILFLINQSGKVHIIGYLTHGIISFAGLLILLCTIQSVICYKKNYQEN